MDVIFKRVSVRNFLDKPVEAEKIELLMRAAMAAPSSTNQQDWEFIVVTDKELLRALAEVSAPPPIPKEALPKNMPPPPPGGPSSTAGRAAAAIVVLGNKKRMRCPENWEQDLGAATENILLEATACGLGAVWMGVAPLGERMGNVTKLFNLPDHILPYCIVAVGYPAKEPPAQQDRYHPEYVHYNTF